MPQRALGFRLLARPIWMLFFSPPHMLRSSAASSSSSTWDVGCSPFSSVMKSARCSARMREKWPESEANRSFCLSNAAARSG